MSRVAMRLDPTTERIEGKFLPVGASWVNDARRAALDRLNSARLPARKDEYWRHTNPDSLNRTEPYPSPLLEDDELPVFGSLERIRIVFVDGVFDPSLSDSLGDTGIEIEQLSDVTSRESHWARELYGVLENRGQTPVARSLAALNTAFATQGVVIRVTGELARPINLIYLHQVETSDATVHNLIRVEAGCELTLLENGPAAARLSKVMEVDVRDGASFHHVRVQGREHQRRAVTHLFARLGQQSRLKSFTLTANGCLTRNECVLELVGRDASAHVAGAAVGDGAEFLHDDTVFVTHDSIGCESRQVFKKVLRNGATGVFQGKILVKSGAQKTDGYQISQSLLLDDDSRFYAKPELEIYADDVVCSHGSTSGAIDETALFYLQSRGIPKALATDLLVLAFLAEALEEVADERIVEDLLSRLEGWLARRRR